MKNELQYVKVDDKILPTGMSEGAEHICLVIDTSGSMQGAGIDSLKRAIRQLLVYESDQSVTAYSAVTFDKSASILHMPTNRYVSLLSAIEGLKAVGVDTLYVPALTLGLKSKAHRIIFLTDGQPSESKEAIYQIAKEARSRRTIVDCIGCGVTGDGEEILRTVADITGGKYFSASDTRTLTEIYARLETRAYRLEYHGC